MQSNPYALSSVIAITTAFVSLSAQYQAVRYRPCFVFRVTEILCIFFVFLVSFILLCYMLFDCVKHLIYVLCAFLSIA